MSCWLQGFSIWITPLHVNGHSGSWHGYTRLFQWNRGHLCDRRARHSRCGASLERRSLAHQGFVGVGNQFLCRRCAESWNVARFHVRYYLQERTNFLGVSFQPRHRSGLVIVAVWRGRCRVVQTTA